MAQPEQSSSIARPIAAEELRSRSKPERHIVASVCDAMLKWAIIAAIIAVVAGAFGFGFIAGAAADIAKVLFFIFLTIFVILLISAVAVGRKVKSAFRHDRDVRR